MREFQRSIDADIEATGRVLEGLTLRWDKRYRVSDDGGESWYVEGWRKRAFEKGLHSTGNVHELRVDHRDVRVGRVSFRESADGLVFQALLDETPAGDAALEYQRADRFRGVSLRYDSDQQRRGDDGTLWRTRAYVRELSLVDAGRPQYDDARVTATRALFIVDADAEAQARATEISELLARSSALLAVDLDKM
jgi:Caudovirus prohead serine protease